MRNPLRSLLLLGAVFTVATFSIAQSPVRSDSQVRLAFTYNAQRSVTTGGNSFWPQGGGAELSAELKHGWGAALNVAAVHTANIRNTGVELTTLTTAAGPRYAWQTRNRNIYLFGQGLVGEAHAWNGVFPSPQGATATYDTFVLQVGGGMDIHLKGRLALRPVEAHWVRTQFPNSITGVQNNLRLGAGFVLHLQ